MSEHAELVDTASDAGRWPRLVVKLLTDDPDPERATAEFTGLRIAHSHLRSPPR